jgi:hypothetical protein
MTELLKAPVNHVRFNVELRRRLIRMRSSLQRGASIPIF